MKVLKNILLILVALAIIFFIGGLFLPKTYSVKRTKMIHASDTVVYNHVANFNNFLKWNPWTKMEPEAKVQISGQPATPGHLWKWQGDKTGEGQMEISKVNPYSQVSFTLTFLKPFKSVATTTFQFEPIENGTKVIWTMEGNNNNTIERWMALNMDGMIGKDFEAGLENLKVLSETGKR